MRIVLDLQGAQTVSRYRGIGRYSLALAQAIARQGKAHEIWICLSRAFPAAIDPIRAAFADLLPPERVVAFDLPGPVAGLDARNQWRMRTAELVRDDFLAQLQPDVVYTLSLFEGWLDDAVAAVTDLSASFSKAATLYDLIPLLNPEVYLAGEAVRDWYMQKVAALKQSELLLAISEYSRQEGIDALGIESGRVVNISSAVSEAFRPTILEPDSFADLQRKIGIRRPYLMYSGALEWRKNVDRLVEAFAELPAEVCDAHDLVLAGRASDYEVDHIRNVAKRFGVAERVVLTGYISDEELIALYSHCKLFVFPSFHEGFGLPALEAMACGAPTIGAGVTSIPEVIGREDALFDPASVRSMTAKIKQALTDEGFREELLAHAPVQAAKFSWDESARRALAAFEGLPEHARARSRSWVDFRRACAAGRQALTGRLLALPREPAAPDAADLMKLAAALVDNDSEASRWQRQTPLSERITWRIEGPFDSSYSLALLNRETARALDAAGHEVVLHSTEGPGDYAPDPAYLAQHDDLAQWHGQAAVVDPLQAEVSSRNLYPPRVDDMESRLNLLHHYAWEESGFPWEWVQAFNENLQGITCLSTHVEKLLADNGVSVPLVTSGCGVDHWERIEPDPAFSLDARSFRFLHVSSCFPRKGADALLKAYGIAFSGRDDVTLVIKTFPNPHNQIHQWLAEARAGHSDFPDVVVIESDLREPELKALYQHCHALVAPSRAEGFGLPLAEAMLSGLPVITTAWGGQRDFCADDTAWLVDYRFVRAESHFELPNSVWAEPDIDHLATLLSYVRELPPDQRQARVERGRKQLLQRFRWRDVAARLVRAARRWSEPAAAVVPRVGWVSTWGTRCGIAGYTEYLLREWPAEVVLLAPREKWLAARDADNVSRCWLAGREDDLSELADEIERRGLDTVVVQFNYNFFGFEHLARFLTSQVAAGRTVVVELHSTTDQEGVPDKQLTLLTEALAQCHRILVHGPADMNRLKELGLVDNVALFPLGILERRSAAVTTARTSDRRIIASYGFFLPHKGLVELVEAIGLMRANGDDVELHMVNAEYPAPASVEAIQQVRQRIAELDLGDYVRLTTDYLSDEASLDHLAATDLVVFPYQHTGESASAAVRHGIASGRPVAVTPLPIFDDVAPAVSRMKGCAPPEMAESLRELLPPVTGPIVPPSAAQRWREAHYHSRLARQLHGLLVALDRQRVGDAMEEPLARQAMTVA